MEYIRASVLTEKLISNRLSESKKVAMYLIWWCMFLSIGALQVLSDKQNIKEILVELLISLPLIIGGTILAFQINKKGDNKNFIERIVLLSLPITIQQNIIFSILYALIVIIAKAADYQLIENYIFYAMIEFGLIYYFIRVFKYIRIISRAN